jgi:DNA-directed RNA polymerase specialized sigma24 family protein
MTGTDGRQELLLAAAGDEAARARFRARYAPLAYVAALLRLRDPETAAERCDGILDAALVRIGRDKDGRLRPADLVEEEAASQCPTSRAFAAARAAAGDSDESPSTPGAWCGQLAPAQRAVILLYFLFSMPLTEIAALLELPAEETTARFTAGLRRWREAGLGREAGDARPGPLLLKV